MGVPAVNRRARCPMFGVRQNQPARMPLLMDTILMPNAVIHSRPDNEQRSGDTQVISFYVQAPTFHESL